MHIVDNHNLTCQAQNLGVGMGRKVGLIGTGLMGRGMVHSLVRKGHDVKIANRTRARAEEAAQEGGTVVGTAAEASKDVEVVVTMLADPAAVIEVFEGKDGVLSAIGSGTIVIDSSTVSPPTTQRIAEGLKARGASLLDAPVFGSRNEAESGTLGFIVGGDRKAFESVKDLLVGCMGKTAHYMGKSGMGATAKLVTNLIISMQLEAYNEGIVLATKAGLDPALMVEMLMTSRAKCGIMEMKGTPILNRDFTPFFALKLMNKDMRLALETAESLGVCMPGLASLKQILSACMGSGLGEEDFSAMIKFHERNAGVEVAAKK